MRRLYILLLSIPLVLLAGSWNYQTPQLSLHLVDIDNATFNLKSGSTSLDVFKKDIKSWEIRVNGKRFASDGEIQHTPVEGDSTVIAVDFSKEEVPAEFNELRKKFQKKDRLRFQLNTVTSTGKTNKLNMYVLIQ